MKTKTQFGAANLFWGLYSMALFMFLGFVLVYLRDFAPGAQAWADSYSNGKHFETRLAHVHGTLFGFLNILLGYLIMEFKIDELWGRWTSRLGLVGLIMPIGILGEVLLGLTPIPVLIGAFSMLLSLVFLAIGLQRSRFQRAER